MTKRRNFLAGGLATAAMAPIASVAEEALSQAPPPAKGGSRSTHPIALSTYSLWRFRNDELRDIDRCIDLADEFGFDGCVTAAVQHQRRRCTQKPRTVYAQIQLTVAGCGV